MTMYYSNFGTYPTVSKQLEEDLLKIIKGRDHYHLVSTPASFFGLIDQCSVGAGEEKAYKGVPLSPCC